jgi:hypothetical protein
LSILNRLIVNQRQGSEIMSVEEVVSEKGSVARAND